MQDKNQKSLDVRNLSVDFRTEHGQLRVVDDVSFSIKPGEFVGLVGESGSGKSVTSLATMGLIELSGGMISTGSVNLNGTDITHLSQRKLAEVRGRDIAMIFQEPLRAMNPSLRVGNQIAEAVMRHYPGKSKTDAMRRAEEMLNLVQIPNARARLRDYPHQMSGGMCQRVMIAMALSCEPDFLIADEPTTALDATVQATILQLIKEVQAEMGLGVLMITHDLGVVAEVCERALIMYAGQIVEQGSVDSIFAKPIHPYSSGLLNAIPTGQEQNRRLPFIPGIVPSPDEWPVGCRFSSRCAHSVAGLCDVGPIRLGGEDNGPNDSAARCVRAAELELPGVGGGTVPSGQSEQDAPQEPADSTVAVPPETGPVLVQLQKLSKNYVKTRNLLGRPTETFAAVKDVTFDVHVGETLAIVGESGAGKSTMGRLVLGLEDTDTGSVVFENTDIATLSTKKKRAWRRHAQMIFQDPYNSLNPRYSIGAAVREALDVHEVLPPEDRDDRVAELLRRVGIRPEMRHRLPYEFSGGQLQRVAIARAISTNPSLIVCDEPVAALDMSIRAQILNLLADLQEEHGLAYVFVTHDLSLVRSIAHRVVVMRNGEVQEIGETAALFENPSSAYTRSLIDSIPNIQPGAGNITSKVRAS